MSETILKVNSLSFSYDEHVVLKDISFEVKKGDFLAIIGPNGGGKSTLIKCVLGILQPLKGEVLLWGKPLKRFKEWYRVGYVPQRAGELVDHLTPITVEEFIRLPEKWYGKAPEKGVVEFLVEKFGIKDFLKKIGESFLRTASKSLHNKGFSAFSRAINPRRTFSGT